MIRKLIDFAPAELALAPRPLEGELTSSWLYRVAAANLVELEELLSGLMNIYPEVHSRTNICLDYSIAPAWSRALARWCRFAESRVHTLDLTRVFPGRNLNWFVHGDAVPKGGRNSGGGSVWWLAFMFCPRSLQFFRFRAGCVGQTDLYPFAILFRELPVERHDELIRRSLRWPDPLADQVARLLKR